jgi:hypothetical protein
VKCYQYLLVRKLARPSETYQSDGLGILSPDTTVQSPVCCLDRLKKSACVKESIMQQTGKYVIPMLTSSTVALHHMAFS